MEFRIIGPGADNIEVINNLPLNFKGQRLYGASPIYGSAHFGEIVFQHYKGDGFDIWFSNYDIKHSTELIGRADIPVLELHIQFSNQFINEWDSFEKTLLRPYQYNLTYTPFLNNKVRFDANRSFHTFDIHFSIEYLQRFAPSSAELTLLLDKLANNQAANLSLIDRFLTPEMIAIVNQMLHCNLSNGLINFFIDSKVKELLVLVLDQVSGVNPLAPIKLSDYDIEKLNEAKSIILADFEDKITLTQLAKKVAINEFKLKKGFKYLFGTTVFGYRHTARMERARQMILETRADIDDIAYMIGFDHPSNFQKAFKKHFNYTIADLKKYGSKPK